jgi:hypothetical protein
MGLIIGCESVSRRQGDVDLPRALRVACDTAPLQKGAVFGLPEAGTTFFIFGLVHLPSQTIFAPC